MAGWIRNSSGQWVNIGDASMQHITRIIPVSKERVLFAMYFADGGSVQFVASDPVLQSLLGYLERQLPATLKTLGLPLTPEEGIQIAEAIEQIRKPKSEPVSGQAAASVAQKHSGKVPAV